MSGKDVVQSIDRVADQLSGRIPTTATVKTPSEEYLVVELVPLSLVKRVSEIESDSNIFQGLFWTLIGGLLGLITSIILNGAKFSALDKGSIATIVAIIIGSIIFFTLWRRSNSRANDAKNKLYDQAFN